MKIKNIIFDWSGTLCDDFHLSFLSTAETLRHFGGPKISKKNYRENFVLPASKFYRQYGLRGSFEEINRYYFDHFSKRAARAPLFPRIKALLKKANACGIRLFVFSTVRDSLLKEMCRFKKISPSIQEIRGDIHDKEAKLPKFCRELKLKPSETLYVGDTDHDISAAKKAGVFSGAILCGYHSEKRLVAQIPDFVWNDHRGLIKFLSVFNSRGVLFCGAVESQAGPVARHPRRAHKFRAAGVPHSRHPPVIEAFPLRYPVPTVGALIFNKGDVFLIQTHKWSHTFGIPGGKIKPRETMIQALKREIKEETGLTLKKIGFALAQDSIHSKEFFKKKAHFLLINFYAESSSRLFRLNDESESGLWVNPKTALKLRLNHPTRKLVEYYLRG